MPGETRDAHLRHDHEANREDTPVFAVRDLSIPNLPPLAFEVPPAGVLAISGPSGSGKTLLLRALADLDPHGGQLSWSGKSCEAIPAPEWRRQVGLLPAEPRFWHGTVGAHFPAEANALGEEFASLRLDPKIRDADPMLLSTGERSRLALLRLLLRAPEVLLLDEPTANLDQGQPGARHRDGSTATGESTGRPYCGFLISRRWSPPRTGCWFFRKGTCARPLSRGAVAAGEFSA